MRNKARTIALGVLLLLGGGCFGRSRPQVPGSTLRIALSDEPSTLDPAVGYDVASLTLEHVIFDGLVGFDARAHVVPQLAARWEVLDDGRLYRFHLRPHLRFQDGRPVRMQDVVYSLDRQFWPQTKGTGTAFYTDIVGADAVLAGRSRKLAGMQIRGPLTLDIHLKTPEPAFLSELALLFTSVIPEGSGEEPGFSRHPIGTGPFRLVDWQQGQRMVFVRNPWYFSPGLPHLQRIAVSLGVNEQIATMRFERGKLDLLGFERPLSAADFLEFWSDPSWRKRFLTAPDSSVYYVGMNCQMAPFNDLLVRRAVAEAIDKRRILKLVNGRGLVAQGVLPPAIPGFDPSLHGYPYDPPRARELLTRAGYPQGFSATYWCSTNGTILKVAQAVQQDLATVGIRLTLKPLSFGSYLDGITHQGTAAIFSGNWTQDYPDPGDFLEPMFDSGQIHPINSVNATFFQDARVDGWLHTAARTLDPTRRLALYRRVEQRVIALAPVVPLYHPVRYVLVQPWIEGFTMNPVWALDATRIEKVGH